MPLREIAFPEDDHFAFQVLDEDGAVHEVPLHRFRDIYREDKGIGPRAK